MIKIQRHICFALTAGLFTLCTPALSYAQGGSAPINYDSISFFEEPIALDVEGVTLHLRGLIDQSAIYNTNTEKDTYNSKAIGEISAETQLPNSWFVGAKYIGNYNRLRDGADENEYEDDIAVFIADEWGSLSVGNVTGSVRELMQRERGVGNADLANDTFLGVLDEAGALYLIRFNTYQFAVTADQEGRAEIGVVYEEPIGSKDYFLSLRLRKGDTSDNPDRFSIVSDADTYGGVIAGQIGCGSFRAGAQLAYEQLRPDNATDKDDHFFGSVMARYKYNAYSFTAEAGMGKYNNENLRAASIGTRVDVARGLSLNMGANYKYEFDDENTELISSLRYEF